MANARYSADPDVRGRADPRTSRARIARFSVTSGRHPADQVADHKAVRVRAEVAVRHRGVVVRIGGCRQLRLAAGTAGRSISRPVRLLPGSACDVGGNDIGGVPVQAAAGPVIPHRCSRVGVRGGLLHVAQRDPGI